MNDYYRIMVMNDSWMSAHQNAITERNRIRYKRNGKFFYRRYKKELKNGKGINLKEKWEIEFSRPNLLLKRLKERQSIE